MFLVFLLAALACVSAAPDDKGPTDEFWGRCPPGYYHGSNLAEGALPCLPCPPGTFQPKYTRHKPCQPHRECRKPGEILLDPGTSLVDAICQCQNGTQRTRLWSFFGERYHCTKCPEGEISHEACHKEVGDSAHSCLLQNPAKKRVPGEPGATICCSPHLSPVMAMNGWHFTCETPSGHQPTPPQRNTTSTPTLNDTSSTPSPNDTSPTDPSRDLSTVTPDSDQPETNRSEAAHAGVVRGVLGGIAFIVMLCLVVLAVICHGRAHPESVCGKLLPNCLAPEPQRVHVFENPEYEAVAV